MVNFKPSLGEKYYFIDEKDGVCYNFAYPFKEQMEHINNGNIFKTYEEALEKI